MNHCPRIQQEYTKQELCSSLSFETQSPASLLGAPSHMKIESPQPFHYQPLLPGKSGIASVAEGHCHCECYSEIVKEFVQLRN